MQTNDLYKIELIEIELSYHISLRKKCLMFSWIIDTQQNLELFNFVHLCLQIYMYKEDLILNNLPLFICHETKSKLSDKG